MGFKQLYIQKGWKMFKKGFQGLVQGTLDEGGSLGNGHFVGITLRKCMSGFKEMFSKYQFIGLSFNFWKNTDLNGASGSITTSNLPC